ADEGLLALPGALGNLRHAAITDADIGDLPLREPQIEGAEAGGDVLVEALGDLVTGEAPGWIAPRQADELDELARAAILLAVTEEEILQCELAPLAPMAEHQPGAQRDQRRRAVADGRAIGDIAAHGAAIADLGGAETPQQLAEIGIFRGDRL